MSPDRFDWQFLELEPRVVAADLPTELAEQLDDLAARHRLTLEALADVDAGRMLEHAKIEAWAAQLAKP